MVVISKINRRYSGRSFRPVSPFEGVVLDSESKVSSIVDTYPVREDGSISQLDVDQFAGQPFMLNPNGFITNDIMMFEECQSDSVARSVLNRLKILHPESIDQNLSLDGMMSYAIPSNYGSPAEFVSANRLVASKVYKLYQKDVQARQAILQEQAAKQMAKESEVLSKSVPNPE